MSAPIDAFRDAMRAHGLVPPEQIIADGNIHRCNVDAPNGRGDGAYKLHLNGVPAGGFQNWQSGSWTDWCSRDTASLTVEERRTLKAVAEESRRQREAEIQQRQVEAAERARTLWQAAQPAGADHPYLKRKQVRVHGLRIHRGTLVIGGVDCDGALIVPLRDCEGALQSLEFITADGEKRYLPGGKVQGCYFSVGRPDAVICIAEGFATSASVNEATGYATACAFNAGNLQAVAQAIRQKFPDARIIVAADHDEQGLGLRAAEAAALVVGGLVAMPEIQGDWNDISAQIGPGVVKAGIDRAHAPATKEVAPGRSENRRSSSSEHFESIFAPEPLRRPLAPPEPYPIEALGPVLSAAVQRAHEIIRAPAAICGQSFLAAASLAAQAHADVEIDGRRELLSIYALTIGESGERKSAVDAVALQEHRDFERKALKEFEDEMQRYERAVTAHEAAKKLVSKQRPKEVAPADLQEYIEHQLEQLGKPPTAPRKPIYFTAAPTLEGMHKLFVSGRPSVGLFHDDAGEFLGGHAMNDDNRLKSAAGLSKLWDRGEFDRVRAGDGANKYFGRRVASHLMIQPVVAERVLSDDILTQQGLLARTLLAWPVSTIGDRLYVEIDVTKDAALVAYHRAIATLLERPRRFAEGSQEELDPPALCLTDDAKQLWVAVHDAIETDQKDGAEYSSIRPWASKAPALILRIAGLLTIIEQPDATMIDAGGVARAAALMKYYLGEAARIVGTTTVPEHVRQAEALLEWCRRERKVHVYSREVLQFGPNAIRTAETFDKAIAVLERAGWAVAIEHGMVLDGKHRRRVWRVRWEANL